MNSSRTQKTLYAAAAILLSTALSSAQISTNRPATLNGSAKVVTTPSGDDALLLTPASGDQAGSAFLTNPITLNADYSFKAFFQFSMKGGSGGADGMTFVLQTEGPNALGGTGGCLGYASDAGACPGTGNGIAPSVAVEFDTYQNSPPDVNNNHVAILTNGQLNDMDQRIPYGVDNCGGGPTFGCMSNGDTWSVWIDYDGAILQVALADNSTTRPANLIKYPIDLASILGPGPIYAGFTAGTGGLYQNHYVFNFLIQ